MKSFLLSLLFIVLSIWNVKARAHLRNEENDIKFFDIVESDIEQDHDSQAKTLRPIVGVLTQSDSEYGEYIAGSYVKYLEAGGARVVPIRYRTSKEELEDLFGKLNGFFIPGGGADLEPGSPFYDTANVIFDLAIKANQNGDYFPIWGTCLGFETLMILGSGGNKRVLGTGYDAEDLPSPITFTKDAAKSDLFGNMPERLQRAIQKLDINFNSHSGGVDMETFANDENLRNFYNILATGVDKQGREFIAAVEAKNGMPFYGLQFHPEKANFEWHMPTKIPHRVEAIQVSQYFANFFIAKTRMNTHSFGLSTADENKLLIENSCKKRNYFPDGYFMETFTF